MSTVPQQVREQYELLPYPHRDPEEERTALRLSALDELGAVNHFCFNGEIVIDKNFQALVAGGGTGDSTVQLAVQLAETDAHITHVDLSEKSIEVARKRLEVRQLTHKVTFKRMSLLDLQPEEVGQFDYINCSGVLHHLEVPEQGLAALSRVLKPEGAMGIMLYGLFGRTAIYQMQRMFDFMGMKGAPPSRELLQTLKNVLNTLPESNWYSRSKDLFPNAIDSNESELYDLMLHPSDVAYTATGLYQFLASSELNLVEYSYDKRHLYRPEIAFRDPAALARIQKLPLPVQQEICEIHWGNLIKHSFWASRRSTPTVDLNDPTCIPFWSRGSKLIKVNDSLINNDGENWSIQMPLPGGTSIKIQFPYNSDLKRCFQLVDDQKSIAQIANQVIEEIASDDPQKSEKFAALQTSFQQTIGALVQLDYVLLRRPGSTSSLC